MRRIAIEGFEIRRADGLCRLHPDDAAEVGLTSDLAAMPAAQERLDRLAGVQERGVKRIEAWYAKADTATIIPGTDGFRLVGNVPTELMDIAKRLRRHRGLQRALDELRATRTPTDSQIEGPSIHGPEKLATAAVTVETTPIPAPTPVPSGRDAVIGALTARTKNDPVAVRFAEHWADHARNTVPPNIRGDSWMGDMDVEATIGLLLDGTSRETVGKVVMAFSPLVNGRSGATAQAYVTNVVAEAAEDERVVRHTHKEREAITEPVREPSKQLQSNRPRPAQDALSAWIEVDRQRAQFEP